VDPALLTERLKAALRHGEADALTFRFLENNDTGARFITRYGPDRTRVAATMLFTLPGIPLVYAGQEIGAAFEPYGPRRPLDWANDPHGLYAFYAKLAHLRATYPALRGRTLQLLDVAPSEDVVGYVRAGPTPRDDVIVLLNFADAQVDAELPNASDDLVGADRFVDLVSGDVIAGLRRIALPPFGARILRRSNESASGR
jgi:glycosidase